MSKNFRFRFLFTVFQIFDSQEFECYLGKREIKMQKTTEGLGIMIIEGSHKTLGKGIFISDIQQNSLAFKVSFLLFLDVNLTLNFYSNVLSIFVG